MGRILAVVNQKGGVGKSTTTVNLAACLGTTGRRVLMVDTDPQGNATSGIGINKSRVKKCIYDVLIDGVGIEEVALPAPYPELKDVRVVPATIQLAGAEVELVSMMSREYRLKSALDAVKNDYDFVIMDCPPSLGLLTINALTAADGVVVPIQCEYYALEGLSQLLDTINLVKKHLNRELEIAGVLLTMFDARTNLAQQVIDEVKGYFGDKVYKTVIPRNIRLSEAPGYGKPINLYDPNSRGAKAYEALCEEVINRG
ncbi:MAG: ParA family protein [Firmicutes bacterium]|nr:ParA family protein [Bacillota bacterium]